MKSTLRVLPDVEAELLSAAMWYEEKRPGLGVEFVAIVGQALGSILGGPIDRIESVR
jgi:hypothetical protein